MEKTELEGLLADEKALSEHIYQLNQQKGKQVFDAFIAELLNLGNPTLLNQLLQIYAGCVVSINSILNLASSDVEPQPGGNTDLLKSAERKRQRTLSMEAFMIRFYQFGIDKAKQPTLDLTENASLTNGNYWLQSKEAQKEIEEFLEQCKLHLSPALAGIAHAYLCDIRMHENMKPLLPRDTAVLLCTRNIGAITLSKGTTGVVIESLNGPDVSFLVDNQDLASNQSSFRIDRKYLNLVQSKKDADIFDLAPHERTIVKELAMKLLDTMRDEIIFAVNGAKAKRLLEPMFYEALTLDAKQADAAIRKFLNKEGVVSTCDIQDAFQTACVRLLIDSHGARPT